MATGSANHKLCDSVCRSPLKVVYLSRDLLTDLNRGPERPSNRKIQRAPIIVVRTICIVKIQSRVFTGGKKKKPKKKVRK